MTEEEALRQIPYRCILSAEVIAVSEVGKTHLSHTQRCRDGRDHLLFGRCQTEKGQRLGLNLKDYTVYPEGLEV